MSASCALTAGSQHTQDSRAVGGVLRNAVKDPRYTLDLVIRAEFCYTDFYLGQVYGDAAKRRGQIAPAGVITHRSAPPKIPGRVVGTSA